MGVPLAAIEFLVPSEYRVYALDAFGRATIV